MEYCEYCGSQRDAKSEKPWRCRRCGAKVSWAQEPPPGDPIPFGPYTLVRRIAAGGMGVVYEARRKTVQDFEKPFAIKRLLPALTFDNDFISMLVEEAKICVQLEHQNIVQVFELDQIEGEYYIAMEWVPGSNFAALLRFSAATRRLIPVPVVAHIVNETLKGLAYAHGGGRGNRRDAVIHRDVSPQNVMIGSDGRIKLTDFGIAKAIASSTVSRIGTVKGKLAYMAPELLAGERATPKVDVFAMGVLMHEALASRRLFRAESEAALISTILRGQVPPLSRYRNDVPRPLERVIRTALTRDPELRFPDAGTLRTHFVESLPHGILEEGLSQSETFLTEFYECVGMPGEPLNPEVDAPFTSRGRGGQAAVVPKDYPVQSSSSFPTMITEDGRASAWRRALLVAIIVLGLGGGGAGAWAWLRYGQDRGGTVDSGVGRTDLATVVNDVEDAGVDRAPADEPDAAKPRRDRKVTQSCSNLTNVDIERAFGQKGQALQRCALKYQAELPKGTIGLSLVIRKSGRVSEVSLTPKQLEGTQLAKCLAGVAGGLRFQRTCQDTTRVTVPLNFVQRQVQ